MSNALDNAINLVSMRLDSLSTIVDSASSILLPCLTG